MDFPCVLSPMGQAIDLMGLFMGIYLLDFVGRKRLIAKDEAMVC